MKWKFWTWSEEEEVRMIGYNLMHPWMLVLILKRVVEKKN